ncbi:MAG: alpha/beta fold hydrolase [Acidobacteriota bacterium]
MHSERIEFTGAFGDRLAARLEQPDGPPRAYALFAHCFTCSKDLLPVHRISRALTEHGIAVMRFDFTGLGESEGDFADTNFSSNLADLRAAVDWLRRTHEAPQLLIGHSLGGAAVLALSHTVPELQAVATIGAPSDTQHLRDSLINQAPALDATEADVVEMQLEGRPFQIRRQLIEDLGEQKVLDAVHRFNGALLVMHSPIDAVVAVDHARRIYDAATHPKSFLSLDDASHLLMRRADAHYVAEVLAAWASRYLPPPAAAAGAPDAAANTDAPAAGAVRVRGGASGYAVDIAAGPKHTLRGDEPPSLGGTDTGPTPYDFLLAALGSCKTITLRMYADRKSMPLEGIEVHLEHEKIDAKDCDDCVTETGKVDRITCAVKLDGSLDDDQRARLMEIADRCPVHRTLTSETQVRSRLV